MIDWSAVRARINAAPYRVVGLVPLFENRVEIELTDAAGTLEYCQRWAATMTRQQSRDYDWTLPLRIVAQDDNLRSHDGQCYPKDAVPLEFV